MMYQVVVEVELKKERCYKMFYKSNIIYIILYNYLIYKNYYFMILLKRLLRQNNIVR